MGIEMALGKRAPSLSLAHQYNAPRLKMDNGGWEGASYYKVSNFQLLSLASNYYGRKGMDGWEMDTDGEIFRL